LDILGKYKKSQRNPEEISDILREILRKSRGNPSEL
jgi:hypothetical protein